MNFMALTLGGLTLRNDMLTQKQISKLGCGLFHCPLDKAYELMPELTMVFDTAPIVKDPIVDVKVSMLMPNQWPCIPNWHFDFVPRDSELKPLPDKRDNNQKMYLLLSGQPFTEFRDGREINPWNWVGFTQFDEHRGTPSLEHCWRLFVRIVPGALCKPSAPEEYKRKHIQVYLDVNNFTW